MTSMNTTRSHRAVRSRRRRAAAALVGVGAVTLSGVLWSTASGSPVSSVRVHGGTVDVPVNGGTAQVRVDSLAVSARTSGTGGLTLSAPAAGSLGTPGPVSVRDGSAHWTYPASGLSVTAGAEQGRLKVDVRGTKDGSTLSWPVTGTDTTASQVQMPIGDGLGVPVADHWWNTASDGLAGHTYDMTADMSMPLWGYTLGHRGVSYLVPRPAGTKLGFTSVDKRLRATGVHTFSTRADTSDYTVTFALTSPSPVAPAQDYRSWLASHGGLVTLKQKIAANPNVARLLGAFHAYTWGTARTAQGVQQMRSLGFTHMWLGYDADGDPMAADAVAAAKKAGYLVGPYDSWANGQDPKTADASTSAWPSPVYPDYCVHQADGSVLAGFHDRGCYLSSQAFARSESKDHFLAQRTRQMTANGADSYFLDVDAAGELYDDYSPAHPMNQRQDEANRLARMGTLSGKDKLVLGSESAGSWASPVIDFSHGSETPVADGLWPLEKDKATFGGYAPQGAPAVYFKPVALSADLTKAMFDPAYRIPLYETALHDSQVNLDRWELSYTKFPALEKTRALLAVLYDTPLNLVLDGPTLTSQGKQLAALQRYFAPLHEAAATEPMTAFRRVTSDGSVQQSVFGNGTLRVTANFGSKPYGSLPAGCVDATLRTDHHTRRLCPGTL
ncbi:glycoside hydrolase [Streptantibioticus parmotrematis]|uniref:glycoside hydrolase n=1 Tax=Streptantibioticus parmotrematis TaxID=2873249 RepID=UPI0033F0930B